MLVKGHEPGKFQVVEEGMCDVALVEVQGSCRPMTTLELLVSLSMVCGTRTGKRGKLLYRQLAGTAISCIP